MDTITHTMYTRQHKHSHIASERLVMGITEDTITYAEEVPPIALCLLHETHPLKKWRVHLS